MAAIVLTLNQQLPEKARKVLGFLVAKGFLRAEGVEPRPNAKIFVKDALWVAEHVEPRVLEVLPAAYLHFPRSFVGREDFPDEIARIIKAIRDHRTDLENYRGIRFKDMVRWANHTLPDRRTRPSREIRRNKTLRLKPDVLESLSSIAARTGKTETRIIEDLILRAAAQLIR